MVHFTCFAGGTSTDPTQPSAHERDRMMVKMQRCLIVVGIGVMMSLLVGCGDRRSKLVGTWKSIDGDETTNLNSDGTCSGELETGAWGILQPRTIRMSGTWRVSGDRLIIKLTDSSYKEDKLQGMQVSQKLVEITGDTFTTINEKGERCKYERVN